MADERVEAAAKAMFERAGLKHWDHANTNGVADDYRECARAALAAADAVGGERVVYTNEEKHRESFVRCYVGAEVEFSVEPGEELVARKRRVT